MRIGSKICSLEDTLLHSTYKLQVFIKFSYLGEHCASDQVEVGMLRKSFLPFQAESSVMYKICNFESNVFIAVS